MRRVIQAGLLLSVVLTGCGDEVAPSTEGLGAPVVDPPPRRPPATSIYDAEGILRESDTVVGEGERENTSKRQIRPGAIRLDREKGLGELQ